MGDAIKNLDLRPRNSISRTSQEIDEERAIDLIAAGFGSKSNAGPVVSPTTAMKFSAVYRCVALIGGTIASLPCEVMERDRARGISISAWDHPAFYFLHDEANPRESAFMWWETNLYYHLLRGNGYSLIGRTRSGAPTGLYSVPTTECIPEHNAGKTRILYRIHQDNGTTKIFDQDDVLHFPCIGWNGLQGLSPISAARESIGLGLAVEEHSSRYFVNGISSDVVLSYPNPMKDEAAKKFREYLEQRYSGLKNARKPLVLTEGGDAKSLRMSAVDAQTIESRDFQVEDICRFYGVPLHMVSSTKKSTSWGTGIEEQTLGFVKFTLRTYLKRIEQEVNRKLIRNPKYFSKFNLDALLRADTKTQAEYFKVMIGGNQAPGLMSVNEIRRLKNLPPLDGDEYNKPYRPVDKSDGTTQTPPDPRGREQ